MNGQVITRISELEKEIKDLKFLVNKGNKRSQKKSMLIGMWKGLKISNAEIENAKKAPFDFDVEKYVR